MQKTHWSLYIEVTRTRFRKLMASKSSKVHKVYSSYSLNRASSFGGFLKEIHQEYTELLRSLTIEEWIEFEVDS